MAKSNSTAKKKWYHKLRIKYRLIIRNEDTYEEKISFLLSRLNVFIVITTTSLILIILTIFIIAFTPLREYIPGYMDPSIPSRVYALDLMVDSLEKSMKQKDDYIMRIRSIIRGEEIENSSIEPRSSDIIYDTITLRRSKEDSILRAEYEAMSQYNLIQNQSIYDPPKGTKELLFFPPLSGIVVNSFNVSNEHYGVDIVAEEGSPVKAVMDGTVVFTEWTLETGYIIGIQHSGSFLSVYKHNNVLLKKQGALVKAGDPIAVIGGSGELSTGPHLHFELWHRGTPVNPEEYITF
ncbi:MAG: M23 family metallopeptidase [Bacteroidetes bacterium]|nr:M23 family metallopeptidase [Bacteroidota bacterium]